ncbi:MAG: VIT1/CCC1 transporter family protein [Myxococcota bacterium]
MPQHAEAHHTGRASWLRAAVLGANDGIISTGSLIVGVAAAQTSASSVLLAGAAGLTAGAMSMAAGEYVSVRSQADSEDAEVRLERREQVADYDGELAELAQIYVERGVDALLARQVAEQLMASDALGSHTRDELGLFETRKAHPVQAAASSAASFTAGGAVPMLAAAMAPSTQVPVAVVATSLGCLAFLGAASAVAGGAPIPRAVLRVTFLGALAMAATAAIGNLFSGGG